MPPPTAERPLLVDGPAPARYQAWLPRPDLLALTADPPTSTGLVPVSRPETTPTTPETAIHRALALPGFLARAQLRRRIRYLRHLRELQLRDLGGFTLELHRFGRDRPELVEAKLASAAETDRELRQLELVLTGRVRLAEVREPGIGGACASCGAVYGSEDRFCSNCGEPLPGTPVRHDDGPSR
ncbi:zinc ribbon domain-containing protein [Conexibacter sp. DBS9H8]|uniref:zinc ribbon domain-containing protein n=1 Tax=Conexibacter sp. DBS9H8 TaxID=2937801 RepID=UPI00200DA6A1|nr:zinc ribbon domain-containing protein [Conexibacter sp. DBS9H8]